jgi:ketosteroid isomerase-like protein
MIIVGCLVSVLIGKTGNAQSARQTSKALYEQLAQLDSALFATVYTCNPTKAASFFTEDLEFYHDKGGLTKTRKTFIEGLERNFCGEQKQKLRRELVNGSLKVYSLGNYGAVQIGDHRFYVTENGQPERLTGIAKFVHVWQLKNGEWKLSRVLSFDHKEIGSNTPGATKELYDSIAHADDLLFAAYNAHDLKNLQAGFTTDLEFYHDKNGLAGYAQVGESFKRIFEQNNGIRRELIKGSLEVYPIHDYGAIAIGSHKFCHKENDEDDCGTFPFIMLWQKQAGKWKISRVISYNH